MRYLLAIKMFLITRAAFATSLSFNSESGRTFRIICQVFITKQKDPSIISDAKILIGHLNLMTLSAGFAFLLLLCLILRHKQFIIFTVHLKQFFMRTTFQNLTICNIHNAVRIFNCRQTMCNNKRGTSL